MTFAWIAGDIDWIGVVVSFNVLMVLMWVLLSILKRNHRNRVTRLKIHIEEIRQATDDDPEIGASLDEILMHIEEAENLGPFKGKRPLSAALGGISALVARLEAEEEEADEGEEGEGVDPKS